MVILTMRVQIRANANGDAAILISFHTEVEKFSSAVERNKFFHELHGRKQIIIKGQRRYEYRRPGLLDEIPHIPVDPSVFIIAREHFRRMENFMNEWEDKVMFKSFPVFLKRKEMQMLEKNLEDD